MSHHAGSATGWVPSIRRASRSWVDHPATPRPVTLMLGEREYLGVLQQLRPGVKCLTVYRHARPDPLAGPRPIKCTATLYRGSEAPARFGEGEVRFLSAAAKKLGGVPMFGTLTEFRDTQEAGFPSRPTTLRMVVAVREVGRRFRIAFGAPSGAVGPSLVYDRLSGMVHFTAQVLVSEKQLRTREGSFRLRPHMWLGPELIAMLKDGVERAVRELTKEG